MNGTRTRAPRSTALLRGDSSNLDRAVLAAGVKCSINADDPLLFGCGLLSEYEACRAELGLSDAALAACATTSLEHARCSEAIRERGLDGIREWLLRGSAVAAL